MDNPFIFPWCSTPKQLLRKAGTAGLNGLDDEQATKKQVQYGTNSLPEEPEPGVFAQLWEAFTDPLALLLTGAAVISAVTGLLNGDPDNLKNALLIEGIVFFMAIVGFVTDRQAGNQLKKLKDLQQTKALVVRGGIQKEIESSELVPGDVIVLKEGMLVPADARVIATANGQTNEALLTGEPEDCIKQTHVIPKNTDLGDRNNMVFSGTAVTGGVMTAIVTSIGTETELGKIHEQLQSTEKAETPLQTQLQALSNFLLKGTIGVTAIVVVIYLFRGRPLLDTLITAVSLAIAFIPEALGAVITIALALGVKEMVSKKAIIKRLPAAEGLGSVKVICTDKTGTITKGRMKVTNIWTKSTGNISLEAESGDYEFNEIAKIAQFCNNQADATERALAEFSKQMGLETSFEEIRESRIHEIPFSSSTKYMSTVHEEGGIPTVYSKGAPEALLSRCKYMVSGKRQIKLTPAKLKEIQNAIEVFENDGMRVLAVADKVLDEPITQYDENSDIELTFVGLVALSDPARSEVKNTVYNLKRAGIIPKMITGDSPRTALAIAKEVGIEEEEATLEKVVLGSELERMLKRPVKKWSQKELQTIYDTNVFARVSPSHKVAIVEALQRKGVYVSMAGDGINDAPAVKAANIGIAMKDGTDITKDVADVVLTGTYSAIASAVEVGRMILFRTRLYIHALLSTNGAEVGIFIVAAVLGLPEPLTAVQLLIINLLGDSWLSIALATEHPDKDLMTKPPRPSSESVINGYMTKNIIFQSILTTGLLTVVYFVARQYTGAFGLSDTSEAAQSALVFQQTAIFVTFMVQKILRSAFTARNLKFNIWEIGWFTNKWSLLAGGVSALVAYLTIFFRIDTVALPMSLLVICFALGIVPAIAEELTKLAIKKYR